MLAMLTTMSVRQAGAQARAGFRLGTDHRLWAKSPHTGQQAAATSQPISPFDHLGQNLIDSFWGWSTLFHLGGAAATFALADSGVDARVFRTFADDNETVSFSLSVPALLGGMLLPVGLPLGLYLAADDDDAETLGAAFAAGQAVVIAFVTNTLLKAITGREPPDADEPKDPDDASRNFRFGFLRGGVFDGWPSGHAMVNTALAAALAAYYRDRLWVQLTAYGWATYVAVAVVAGMRGSVHWLSDGVAGVAMGFAIGHSVGTNFYRGRTSARGAESGIDVRLLPLAGSGGGGLAARIVF